VELSRYDPEEADDMALVQEIAERIRGRIQGELDAMTGAAVDLVRLGLLRSDGGT
jgi:hypothetical protein